MLDEAADKYPNRPAVIFQNTRISYKKLREKAELFAGALKRLGVKTGQRVALMMPNMPQTVVAFWGIIKAGGVVVMTNPLYMEKEIIANMQDSGAEHIVMLDLLSLIHICGALRPDSVRHGLAVLPADVRHVLIHDAARPFVSPALIRNICASLESGVPGAIPALPVTDTIKTVSHDLVTGTLPRHTLRAIQTPQGFRLDLLLQAHCCLLYTSRCV